MLGIVRLIPRTKPVALILATALTVSSAVPLVSADLRPDYQPAAYAIRGAKIVPVAGDPIESGTVVVRDGVIVDVGPSDRVEAPFDAEVIDGKGLIVYPGFIDLYTTTGQAANAVKSLTGPGRDVNYSDFALPRTPPDNRNGITPEYEVAGSLEIGGLAEDRRKLGFTDVLVAPGGAIATGQSALVSTSGLPRRESVLKAPVALHIALRSPSGSPFGEGHSHDDEFGTADTIGATPGPTQAPGTPIAPTPAPAPAPQGRRGGGSVGYPTSLMGVVAHLRQAMLDAENHHDRLAYYDQKGGPRPANDPALDALYAARTRAMPVWWEANARDEIHRALDLAEEFGTDPVIVGGREAGKAVARLRAKDVPVVLRLDFPEEPKVPSEAEYRKKPIEERAEPLKVLAEKLADWKERVAVARTLADANVRFAFVAEGDGNKADSFHAQLRKVIAAGLSPEAALDALTRRAAEIAGVGQRLGTIEKGKLGHLVVMTAPFGDEKAKVRYVLADGIKFDLEKNKADSAKEKGKGEGDAAKKGRRPGKASGKEEAPESKEGESKDEKKDEAKPGEAAKGQPTPAVATPETGDDQPPETPFVDIASEFDADRRPSIKTGGTVLIKDATILTVTRGTIPKGSILVRDGKIAEVGPNVVAPEGVTVIDATGMVAMPGIIDTHSHQAIQGGVNEMSLSIVPEVRVKDVVTGDDPGIYRALAGGTTTARLLHGSANTIGGQDAVIKHKPGQPGRDLMVKDGPQGVKFALGENVTRRTGRFPNTRMGVEATIERAFEEGRAYGIAMKAYEDAKNRGEAGPPPRRDLRLEALSKIVDGSIKIHSHCYRSDEILMLLRVAARYGVRVQSLQHVLEGYKVAAEIAAHGASASTFSDWWAYKIEAFDAIPFNAALMTQAGVSTVIKSDSEELIRHLHLEAAKMVKYGGLPEDQALAMITINSARELGLDRRIGSIEVGKDADIAIFNAHPFDGFARCELALVDGEVQFQRKSKDGKLVPRAGDHVAMPAAGVIEAKARPLDLAIAANGTYAVTGATLHPVTGPDIPNGTIVISGGKIAAIGDEKTEIPPAAKVVDARGLDLWPGLIDAGTPLGLYEVGSLQETQDSSDSAEFQPELRAAVALHPDSELIPVARANGILAAFVQPSGGVISGQGCVIGLDGWVPSEMVVLERAGLVVNIPRYVAPGERRGRFGAARGGGPDPDQARKDRLEEIREQFRKALAYDKVVAAARDRKAPAPTPDPRLTALVPYAKGEKPVIFRAEDRTEILDALKIAADLKLKAVISGGDDAWKVADALKAAKVPVLVGGTLRLPSDATDPYDSAYANPARLHEAGVSFAIKSGGSDVGTASRNLPYDAAMAVAFGLPEEAALKAVTLAPAEILGVADQLGSLEVGKRANLVLTAGHVLQPTTEVKGLFLAGKPLPPESRHTRLYAKYQRRLAEVKAGTAPLGLDVEPGSSSTPAASPATGGQGGRK
ncbi:amidohydrolase family protein [Tundrisphaera lichenicola]|uniref:amidohydrolase family protein n=1 Tax=Tundrisphaera lichenicola TaxID=2029860 RepID=UPI003EBA347A